MINNYKENLTLNPWNEKMSDVNKVTIFNLETENVLKTNDYVPVSDGTSTRKINLNDLVLGTDLHNVLYPLAQNGKDAVINTFIEVLNIQDPESGLLVSYGANDDYLKTSMYSINKTLPGNKKLDPSLGIDYTRDVKLEDVDIPVTLLGKELTKNNASFSNLASFLTINNITEFDQYSDGSGVSINDYVHIMNDETKGIANTYYVLTDYDSKDGTFDKLLNGQDTISWKYFGQNIVNIEVESYSDLPATTDNGTIALVTTDNTLYKFNNNAWKEYIDTNEVSVYHKQKVHSVIKELSTERTRTDLANIPLEDRKEYVFDTTTRTGAYTGTVFDYLPDFVQSKVSNEKYRKLYELDFVGVAGTKGDLPEGNYYDPLKDIGNSRFARKALDNLKVNGTEQLYDATTDWGDNRFAHKALDNLKSNTVENIEDYDINKDYGTSRFARKNLNNLRSATYDILNDKVSSKISGTGFTTFNFVTNNNFNKTVNDSSVTLTFDKYVLNSVAPSATSLKTDYSYVKTNETVPLPVASKPESNPVSTGNAGIVTAEQAEKVFNALIDVNGIDSETTYDTNIDIDYKNKAIYKKILAHYDPSTPIEPDSQSPETHPAGDKVGERYKYTGDNKTYYYDGVNWIAEDETHVFFSNSKVSDGDIVLTGYNIPVSANDWNSKNWRPNVGNSVSERIERLETLGVYLGAVDVPGLILQNDNFIYDNTQRYWDDNIHQVVMGTTRYWMVNSNSQITPEGSAVGYQLGDAICAKTNVDNQLLNMRMIEYQNNYTLSSPAGVPVFNITQFNIEVLSHGALYKARKPFYVDEHHKLGGIVDNNLALPDPSTITDSETYWWIIDNSTNESQDKCYHVVSGAWVEVQTTDSMFNHVIFGGSGSGLKIKIETNKLATQLPRSINEIRTDIPNLSNATVNDYINVRFDTIYGGVSTRYVITRIDSNGNITWGFDIFLDNPTRNFVQEPIAYNELANNAVHNNNILDGTIGIEKLGFAIPDTVEVYNLRIDTTGVPVTIINEKDSLGYYKASSVDWNDLPDNKTYVLVGGYVNGGTTTMNINSPVYNRNITISNDTLSQMSVSISGTNISDTSKWYVTQYILKDRNGVKIAGYQKARNMLCPGVEFSRTMKYNGTTSEWVSCGTTSTDAKYDWTLVKTSL